MDIKQLNETLLRIAEGIEKYNEEHIFNLQQFMGEDDEDEYMDVWKDIKPLTGFNIPLLQDGSQCTETVNLIFPKNLVYTVKRNPVLIKYLTDRFINKVAK